MHADTGVVFHHDVLYHPHADTRIPYVVPFLQAVYVLEDGTDPEGGPENILFVPNHVGHDQDQQASQNDKNPQFYVL